MPCAFLFTNNRSTDGTLDKIREVQARHDWIDYLTLSRNHGYQVSVLSGMTTADADLYMVCDVDCEDPPEMLLTSWNASRRGPTWLTASAPIAPTLRSC